MLKIGAILGNRYEIIEKIGAGGMSIVYRARDTKLERSVTVKVLRDEFITDDDFVSRFKIEAQAAASLSHPNIVNVYDVGTEYDTYYIVMEYIHGCTLKEIIIKEAPFDNKIALNYALKIAAALQHAHKNHIVHRDIKPQNILVTPDGELKVTDFGIAHAATSSTVTMTSTAIGSVHYFSPEQARGGYVDEKSDLYSLGIVMYEMLTAKLPFEGDSSVSIALKHINEDLPSIATINPNISRSLDGIIVKATQKRVDQRYTDIDNMIADMKKALNDPSGNFIEKNDSAFSATQKLNTTDIELIRKGAKPVEKTEYPSEKEYDSISDSIVEDNQIEDEANIEKNDEADDDNGYEVDVLDKSEEIKVIISAITTAFAIIVLICSIVYVVNLRKNNNSPNSTLSQSTIEVPDLLGKTFDEASEILTANTLLIVTGERVESDTYDKGQIVKQSPAKGDKVKKNTQITVDISTGSNKYEVPDLKNLTNIQAGKIIDEGKTFTLAETKYEFNDDVEVGLVIRQEPNSKTQAKLGAEITITISKGPAPKTIQVPSIVGLSESKAIAKLKSSGLTAGNISYAESKSVEKGLVVKQLKAAGTELSTNDSVGFIVSTGKPEATTAKESTKPSESTTVAKESTKPSESATTAKESESTTINEIKPTEPTTLPESIAVIESTTEKIKEAKKVISISAPTVELGQEKVRVKIIKVSDPVEEYSIGEKSISEFPLSVEISGNGTNEVQIYMDGVLEDVMSVNFD